MEGFDAVVISAERLRDFALRVLAAIGVPDGDAAIVADSLVEAELRGVSSHGIMRLPRYARGLRAGNVNRRPQIRSVGGRAALAIFDGDNGLGCVVGVRAMATAIERAREFGVGITVARNSNHFGAAAYYPMMALGERMIGFATTNAPGVMAPWGSRDVILGNNPIAWAIPAGEELPLVLDMALSASARGKIQMAKARGERLPLGWAADADGKPTDDPDVALGGMLLPAGGYKGYCQAVIMEALAGILPGAQFLAGLPPATVLSADALASWGVGHFFMALDVAAFMPADEFGRRVDKLIRDIKAATPADGGVGPYLPGEIEFQTKARRLAYGIPLAQATLHDLRRLGAELGVVLGD
jgi:LDH2 family malate/lactate/ureidoglycolate dehydrogenase